MIGGQEAMKLGSLGGMKAYILLFFRQCVRPRGQGVYPFLYFLLIVLLYPTTGFLY